MPGPDALPVRVVPSIRRRLLELTRAGTTPHQLFVRAQIVLLAGRGVGCAETARRLGVSDRIVREWRRRFRQDPQVETLDDRPRSGRPPSVPLVVRCELLKLACSRPTQSTAPFRDVWTHAALQAALRRATGLTVSVSEIGRILRDEELRPHRVRYWLHSPDPKFRTKCKRLCKLYTQPPPGATILCVDEKTCIQALERKRGLVPAARRRDGRLEFEYRRRGTTTLLAALDPQTGQVFGQCSSTRTAEDLLAFLGRLAARYSGQVYIVWDNLNIHHGERWVAFNRRHGGRFHFVYTPLHASWMNQVEVWFGILQRRVLRYGSFRDLAALRARIRGFVAHWNRREAHPFRWKFRGVGRKMRDRAA